MDKLEGMRRKFHKKVCAALIYTKRDDIPSMADVASEGSKNISRSLVKALGFPIGKSKTEGQTAGKGFEDLTKDFLEEVFDYLQHIRPGKWRFSVHEEISAFTQYKHLAELTQILKTGVGKTARTDLKTVLGDYLVTPDIVILRQPLSDKEVNRKIELVSSDGVPHLTPLRKTNSESEILHASISCKWTIRSDRAQNARTEALGLIRNRKGNTPHIAVVTAEPLPSRIASIALGTGDVDCVYHFALHELQNAVKEVGNETEQEQLDTMVNGRRLRDIADLPFDLAI